MLMRVLWLRSWHPHRQIDTITPRLYGAGVGNGGKDMDSVLKDGRAITIKVGRKQADHIFDKNGEETFDPTIAVEYLDSEYGNLVSIHVNDKVTVKVG